MTQTNLKLLLINSTPYKPEYPARTEIIELFGNFFPKLNHKVVWINPGNYKQIIHKKYNDVDIYIIPFSETKSVLPKIINTILHSLNKLILIEKLIYLYGINIIQSRNSIINGFIASRIKKKFKIPFVYQLTFLNTWNNIKSLKISILNSFCRKITSLLHKRIMKNADLLLPTSIYMKRVLENNFKIKSDIFPLHMCVNTNNFYPLPRFEELLETYGLKNKLIYIYIGTLAKKRHLELVLNAFSIVVRNIRNAKLLMVGEGDGKDDLVNLVNKLNLKKHIIFTGSIPYSDVPKYICVADIGLSIVPPLDMYILSSPTKLLEYMACGIPTIANQEILYMKDIVKLSKSGILIKFDIKSLADEMIKLAKDKDMINEMGVSARKWIINNRSYEKMAKQLETIYIQLLKN